MDPDNLVQIIAASTLFSQKEENSKGEQEPVTAVAGNNQTGQVK